MIAHSRLRRVMATQRLRRAVTTPQLNQWQPVPIHPRCGMARTGSGTVADWSANGGLLRELVKYLSSLRSQRTQDCQSPHHSRSSISTANRWLLVPLSLILCWKNWCAFDPVYCHFSGFVGHWLMVPATPANLVYSIVFRLGLVNAWTDSCYSTKHRVLDQLSPLKLP